MAPLEPSVRPSLLAALALQPRLLREPWRRRRQSARLANAPIGAGETVLVLPGMGVGDFSTVTLRRFLGRHGFDARGWGLGRHRPEVWKTMPRALALLERTAAETGGKVSLVGWSLGGLVARELARLRPDLVRRVVTLGSPVRGGLRHTAIAGLFQIQGWDLDHVARLVEAADRVPIRVPVTAIWSRRDGIVAWQACVVEGENADNVEVGSVHWGMGLDPDVLVAVAERLAAPPSAP
jgi:alpha-beta hydrolase superfamily lysophospholipase